MELTVGQALQQGVTAHKEGKLHEAERLYLAILQSQPLHPDANHNLGVLAISVNKADVALPLFKTALEANPKIEQFWLSYIDALIKEKQFENAKQVLEQAKKQGVARDKVDAIEAQITTTTQVNEPKLVVQKKSLTLSEKRKKLVGQKKQKKRKKQNFKGNNPSDTEIKSLLEHYQNGRYDDAEKLAQSLTERFPEHQFGWNVLGAIFRQTGRSSEAINVSQKSVALSPQDPAAQNNLGNTLKNVGRLDEAEASFRKAIALKPDFAEAHSNLGATLKELGRLDEAEASYTEAIALKADFAMAHNNLGNTLKELGRLDEAEAGFRKAIALKPDFAKAYNNLGNTLKELGRLEEAEANYTQAIAFQPDYAEAHSNLGVTLRELGRLDEAKTSCRQAIAFKPDYAEAHNILGVILQEKGRLDEAEANYRQAIALKPDFALAHFNLGKNLYKVGYKDLALESIEKANDIDPQLKGARLLLSVMKSRKSREDSETAIGNMSNTFAKTGLTLVPLILNRVVEEELISNLYDMSSRELDKTIDARYGSGKCSPDFSLFNDSRSIIQNLAEDLTKIMMEAVKSEVYIYDSFFNILSAGGGSTPHKHLHDLDKDTGFDLGKQKYSLVYYLSVGDQHCSEPGMLKLYDPVEDILPVEGMIAIIPATRLHSAVYGGKTDRVMIGVNFYSL